MAMGICMDLNAQPPAIWTLEDGPYEIADYTIQKNVNILLLLNAWLDSDQEPEHEKDWHTLNYWAMRLRPLWARCEEFKEEDSAQCNSRGESIQGRGLDGRDTVVIVCNRCGSENGRCYK
jgi:protein N-terminal amidase